MLLVMLRHILTGHYATQHALHTYVLYILQSFSKHPKALQNEATKNISLRVYCSMFYFPSAIFWLLS